jgi:hypothetical protein
MKIGSTWHGWMNFGMSTISIPVDLIFMSVSDQDCTPPLPKKGERKKRCLCPSFKQLENWVVFFFGAEVWAVKE